MSTYVVGDIQGCYAELQALLETVGFSSTDDALWVAGDMINRGPDNLRTLHLLRGLPNLKVVLGNHDLHFLAVARTSRGASRSDTLDDLLGSADLEDIIHWMLQFPLAHYSETHDTLLVHAGIPPNWTAVDALGYAAEVETVLQGEQADDFFEHMYGNEPARLSPEMSGIERWRVITNYLTRLRFCSARGEMELVTKTDIAPAGYAPWFSYPRPDATRILFGHWAALEGKTPSDQFVALDTGCVWGRALTALRLEDNKLFSVPAQTSQ